MRSPPLLERALSELAYAEISRCSVTRASLTPPDRSSHRRERERKREQDKDAGPSVVQVPQTTAENDGPRVRNEDLARSKRSKLLRKRGPRMTSRDAKRYKRFPCLPDRSMRTLGRLSVAKSNLSRECCVVGSTCAKSKTSGCRVAAQRRQGVRPRQLKTPSPASASTIAAERPFGPDSERVERRCGSIDRGADRAGCTGLQRHRARTSCRESARARAVQCELRRRGYQWGASDLTQLFFRPVARIDPYSTPAPDVFVCSSSTPPGGGVHGMCGYWAARSVLSNVFGNMERHRAI